jgi:hypothetical protein
MGGREEGKPLGHPWESGKTEKGVTTGARGVLCLGGCEYEVLQIFH